MKETYPRICVAHPSIFSALEIERYEAEIISNPSATEHDVSRFFAIYPKFLLLGEGKEVRRETVLFGSDDNPIGRVDFFRRSFGQLRWDIVELKRPHIEFISGADTKHPYLSAGVQKAVSQVQDYRQWIDESVGVRTKLNEKGISVFRPGMIVVAGRDNHEVPPEVAAELTDRIRRQGVHLHTYDSLFAFAREHYESNHVIILPTSISVANIPWLIVRRDLNGRIVYANDEYAKSHMSSLEEIIGKRDEELWPRDLNADGAYAKFRADDERVLRTGQVLETDEEHIRPDGVRAFVHVVKVPLRDTKGDITGVETKFRVVS